MSKLKQILKNPANTSSSIQYELMPDENRFMLQNLFLFSQLDDEDSFNKLLTKKLKFLEPFGFEQELVTDGSPGSQDFHIELDPASYYTFLNFAAQSMPTHYFNKVVDLAIQENNKSLLNLNAYSSRTCIQEVIVHTIKNHDSNTVEKILKIFEVSDKTLMQIILLDKRHELASYIDEATIKNPYIFIETLDSSNYRIIHSNKLHMYGSDSKDVKYKSDDNLLFSKYLDQHISVEIRQNMTQAVIDLDKTDIQKNQELRNLLKNSLVKTCLDNSKHIFFPSQAPESIISKQDINNHIEQIIKESERIGSIQLSIVDKFVKTYSIIIDLIENNIFSMNESFKYKTYDGEEFEIPIKNIFQFKYRNNPEKLIELETKEKVLEMELKLPKKSIDNARIKI